MKKKKLRKGFPGLEKKSNLKIRHELLDQDYIDKLSPEEKMWLNNFNLEYVQADFNHPGKRLHKKKMKVRKVAYTGKKRKFDIGKKEVQDANNARNRDAFAITKSNFILEGEEKLKYISASKSTNAQENEDFLIEIIDHKDKLIRSKKW